MSLQTISWRKVRRLNVCIGTKYVHAAVNSDGRVWLCVTHDGTVEYVECSTGERIQGWSETTTSALLRSRTPRNEGEAAWLAQLDERAAQLLDAG